ncbi:MAG TPA: LTA synthase family protein [Planctomycetota bacterium]|nr:LTA synthase family protein [Planctomycetota bacterium]
MTRLAKSLVLLAAALVVFVAGRLALFLVYHGDFAELGARDVLLAFVRGIRFDLAVVAIVFAVPLAMLNLPLPIAARRGWVRVWAWVAYALFVPAVLVLAGDLVYYAHVHRHVGNELLLMTADLDYLAEVAVRDHGLALTAILALLVVGALCWSRVIARARTDARPPRGAFVVLLLATALAIRGSFSGKALAAVDAFRGQSFAAGNLSLNGAYTALRASARGSAPEMAITLDEARAALDLPDEEFPLVRRSADAHPTRKNVVVLLLESWDVRYVDSYREHPLGHTPEFDRVAKEGLLFDDAFAASQRSIGAVQAILAGVPSVPGVSELGFGLELSNITRIGAIAAGHGYDTLFVQGARRRSYYMDSVAAALGFAHFFGMEDVPPHATTADVEPKFGWDGETLAFALDRMDEFEKPFLAFVVTGTTHSPYADPGDDFHAVPHEPEGENGYVNTLRYSDWALGRFFDGARNRRWYENTVFLVCADHVWRTSMDANLRDQFRIPFLLVGAGIRPGRCAVPRSQLDCLPWIVDTLGFDDAFAAMAPGLLARAPTTVVVNKGLVMGILSERGCLQHSLAERIDTHALASDVAPEEFDLLERRLLATCRLTHDLLATNRWYGARAVSQRFPH